MTNIEAIAILGINPPSWAGWKWSDVNQELKARGWKRMENSHENFLASPGKGSIDCYYRDKYIAVASFKFDETSSDTLPYIFTGIILIGPEGSVTWS